MQSPLVMGQLLTPLTRYKNWGGLFAMDNGAFTKFPEAGFRRMLKRNLQHRLRCLFVTCPDIVGNARRTLDIFHHNDVWLGEGVWPVALVAQNGLEDLDIPWWDLQCLFIGGIDPWKESNACADLVREAKRRGKWVHVGRVNTTERFELFHHLGADSCDGSGVSRYDHMLANIEAGHRPSDSRPAL